MRALQSNENGEQWLTLCIEFPSKVTVALSFRGIALGSRQNNNNKE